MPTNWPRWTASSTSSTPGGPRSATRRCGRCPDWSRPSRRRCASIPPLILLLRVAKEDVEVDGFTVRAGQMVGASPAVSNRIAEDFPDADAFRPARYLAPREEDRSNPWTWIPFGAGRHRCVGAAFAMMQLKAIFSVLLLRLGVRTGPALRQLPQRPLEDGGPAPAALRRTVSPQEGSHRARTRSRPDVDAGLGGSRSVPGSRRLRIRGAERLRTGSRTRR